MSETSGLLPPSKRAPAAAAAIVIGVAVAARCVRRITVHGASMWPALAPGDRVVALPAWRLAPGEIVVVADPTERSRMLVKRVTAVDRRAGTVSVEGDNRDASTDSRAFGPVARRAVRGRVVYRYAPAGRSGRLGQGRPVEVPNPLGTLPGRYHLRRMTTSTLEALLAPGYLEGLPSLAIAEIRYRRDQASEVEVRLSYVRRLIQGRLDIVLAEVERRESGLIGGDIADLVDRLPEILSDRVRSPGLGRLPTLLAPADLEGAEVDRLDTIVDADQLGTLPQLDVEEVRSMARELAEFEREVSVGRKALHEVIDRLQDELVRRYRTGEANVDTLLS